MLCLLAGLLAWIGYREIQSLRTQLDAVPEMIGTRVALSEWQGATATNAARVVAILRSNDQALGELLAEDVKATSASISSLQKRIEAMPMSDDAKRSFGEVGNARAAYIAAREETIKLKREKNAEAAKLFDTKFYPALAGYELSVSTFVDDLSAKSIGELAVAREDADRGVLWLGACVALFFVVASILVWLMVRSITAPVKDAVDVADALARGDLTRRIEPRSDDEIGALMRSLATASEQLAILVRGIQDSASTIS